MTVSSGTPKLGELGLSNFPPYLMNRIIGRYNASLRLQLAKLDLTTAKARSLAVLSVNDGLLIGDLAVYAVTEQSTLSRALDRMQEAGLVRREVARSDNRAVRVFITDAGRQVFEKLWPHMASEAEKMFNGIPDDEQRAFVATLQKVLGNIRKHDL